MPRLVTFRAGRRRAICAAVPELAKVTTAKPKRQKVKPDPAQVAAARELRDRWLEKVNAPGGASRMIPSQGKYEVSKQFGPPPDAGSVASIPSLPEPIAA